MIRKELVFINDKMIIYANGRNITSKQKQNKQIPRRNRTSASNTFKKQKNKNKQKKNTKKQKTMHRYGNKLVSVT